METTMTRVILVLALLAMCAAGVQAQESDRRTREYGMGRELGTCLARGCRVFVGTVTSVDELAGDGAAEGPPPTRVEMRVDSWLTGQGPPAPSTVTLQRMSRPAASKTSVGPWTPWEGAQVAVGQPLFVAEWQNRADMPTWQGNPQELALVVSDPELIRRLQTVVGRHARLERGSADVGTLLARTHVRALQGFLISYVMHGLGRRDVIAAAGHLATLLGSRSFPPSVSRDVSEWLTSNFYRFSEPTRTAVTDALVTAGASDDGDVAAHGIAALVRLSDDHLLRMQPQLDAPRRGRLARNYGSLVERGALRRGHAEFEQALE